MQLLPVSKMAPRTWTKIITDRHKADESPSRLMVPTSPCKASQASSKSTKSVVSMQHWSVKVHEVYEQVLQSARCQEYYFSPSLRPLLGLLLSRTNLHKLYGKKTNVITMSLNNHVQLNTSLKLSLYFHIHFPFFFSSEEWLQVINKDSVDPKLWCRGSYPQNTRRRLTVMQWINANKFSSFASAVWT